MNGASTNTLPTLGQIVTPRQCALLVIDMQNDFVSSEGVYARWGADVAPVQRIVPGIADVLDVARRARVTVAYAMNSTLPNGASDTPAWRYFKQRARPGVNLEYSLEGSWGQQIIPELSPLPGDLVVKKHRSDAFFQTELDKGLRRLDIQTVVLCGTVTYGCVEASIRHAAFLDYYTVLVGDCCAGSDPKLHQAALEVIGSRHDVVAADELVALWSS